MTDKHPEFMRIDLARLTWSGWLLMLITLAVVLAGFIAVMLLLKFLGIRINGQENRWLALIVLGLALGGGAVVFQLGKRLFERMGFPILRSE